VREVSLRWISVRVRPGVEVGSREACLAALFAGGAHARMPRRSSRYVSRSIDEARPTCVARSVTGSNARFTVPTHAAATADGGNRVCDRGDG
jgi:hypothetical protein